MAASHPSVPIVGIPADRRLLNQHFFHCVGEKYVRAIWEGAEAAPVLLPALGDPLFTEAVVDRLDGVLLTGSPSNVEPHHYGGPGSAPGTLHDPERDASTLPLIPQLVQRGIPLLAICRGLQETNVAFGGTLWQKLQDVEGLLNHRENSGAPLDEQYGPAHEVTLAPGGLLRRLAGSDRLRVNSLHAQGVQQLAPGLEIEATAPDGVVEAFRVRDAAAFAVAVQWHPEWKLTENEFSRALFAAFGAAVRQRAARHTP